MRRIRAIHVFGSFGTPGFSRRFLPIVLIATGMGLLGCGQENELGRLPFSGTVTLNGKPLEAGSISFEPTQPGEDTTRSGASIVDGKFAVEAMKGVPPGKYLVRINAAGASQAPPENQAPGMLPPPPKELIPPQWNVRSEETVTIKEGAENHFTFDIQTGG